MVAPLSVRQEPRFNAREAMPVQAVITAGDRQQAGRLADLSFSGARIEVDEPLAFETQVELSLTCPAAAFDLKVQGVVRWARPLADGGRWSLGLRFREVVSEGRVAEFFTRGIVDRRGKPRVEVKSGAAARFELLSDMAQIQVLNASTGGCCLTTSAACHVGQKVRFSPPEAGGLELIAEVCWARQVEDGWLAGCHFLPECPREAIDVLCQRMKRPAAFRRRRFEFLTAAAILLALTAGAVAWTWKLLT